MSKPKKGTIATSKAYGALDKLKTDIAALKAANSAINAILNDKNKIAEDLAAASVGEALLNSPVKDTAAVKEIVDGAKLIVDPASIQAVRDKATQHTNDLTRLGDESKILIKSIETGYNYFVGIFKALKESLGSFKDAFGVITPAAAAAPVTDIADIEAKINQIKTDKEEAKGAATIEAMKLFDPLNMASMTNVKAKKEELHKAIDDDPQYNTVDLEKTLADAKAAPVGGGVASAATAAGADDNTAREKYKGEVNKVVTENFYGNGATAVPFSNKCSKSKHGADVNTHIEKLAALIPNFGTTATSADDSAAAAAATVSLPENIVWTEPDILDTLLGHVAVLEKASQDFYNAGGLIDKPGLMAHGIEFLDFTE
ncbi:MAG UNVERIFIED_CONTAM: hypothetical protein LVQ98_01840 [Rickettsiaceae bacterium]|jgi:hypothetical protein